MTRTSAGDSALTSPRAIGHAFDEAALARWMTANIAGFRGPMTVEKFSGGQSNPTYRLSTPGADYVLRRKPPGPLLPGAHAVDREARVQTALGTAGFPVARIHGLCLDETVIGSWFYVMDMIEGRIFWDATFPEVPRAERRAYFAAMNATIARLHALDVTAIELGDYGKPSNYFARQIARWSRQYLADEAAGRDPGMDSLIEWLPTAIPPGDEASLIHGDFRCDNIIFAKDQPRSIAVHEWELSTIGHPLADFAYHAMMYRMPPDIVAGLGGANLAALAIPDEAEYRALYCENTCRAPIDDQAYTFYIAFNLFRLAAIFHGIKGRVIRGTAASASARERAGTFPRLVELARVAADECQ